MPLTQLLFQRPICPVHDSATLHRRSRIDLLRPALNIGVALHIQKFPGANIGPVQRNPAIPGPDRNIGDRILIASDIFMFAKLPVEHVELPLHLHRVAVDGIFYLFRRIGEEMAKAPAQQRRAAHLPEQP